MHNGFGCIISSTWHWWCTFCPSQYKYEAFANRIQMHRANPEHQCTFTFPPYTRERSVVSFCARVRGTDLTHPLIGRVPSQPSCFRLFDRRS